MGGARTRAHRKTPWDAQAPVVSALSGATLHKRTRLEAVILAKGTVVVLFKWGYAAVDGVPCELMRDVSLRIRRCHLRPIRKPFRERLPGEKKTRVQRCDWNRAAASGRMLL